MNPGYAVVAIVTLALGIGANTAIFTLVDAVLLKSLPVSDPGQLYRLGNDDNCCLIGGYQDNWGIYSYDLYKQFRDHTPEFSEMPAFQGGQQDLAVRRSGSPGSAIPSQGEFVSGNYFSTLGLGAFAGRLIQPSDDITGAPPVAVMSYRTWQQHFGLDASVVGATLNINTVPYTITGIAPSGFFGDRLQADPPDFWMPIATEPVMDGKEGLFDRPDSHWLYVIGRLKPGAEPASVQAEVTAELLNWLRSRPDLNDYRKTQLPKQHINLAPAGGGIQNLQLETSVGLRLLMVIAGLVLLIACANVANLLLARGAAARAERPRWTRWWRCGTNNEL